jgi:hypothetical protein
VQQAYYHMNAQHVSSYILCRSQVGPFGVLSGQG